MKNISMGNSATIYHKIDHSLKMFKDAFSFWAEASGDFSKEKGSERYRHQEEKISSSCEQGKRNYPQEKIDRINAKGNTGEAITPHILIIDDDPLVVRSIKTLLKKVGYVVSTAKSGQEALELIKQNNFNLIISDVRMPEMSGFETLKRIKDSLDNTKKTIPAVIITGYAGEDASQDNENLGIVGCLYKPFETDELVKLVKKSLEPSSAYERKHPRILATFPVKIEFSEEGTNNHYEISAQTLTLSEGGISMVAAQKIPVNTKINVSIISAPNQVSITAKGCIIWLEEKQDEYYYGVQFSSLPDASLSFLTEILNKYKSLSEDFIKLTQQLKEYVQKTKDEFDEFDRLNNDKDGRIKFLIAHKENIFQQLTEYFNKIWNIVEQFDRDRYIIHKDYYQRTLDFLLLDPIETNRRIYQKPLGYPGDYVIMNYIYEYNGDKSYLGNSTYEKLMNHYTCNIPVSRSNIARKDFLKEQIIGTISRNNESKIMSLACGSARELIELLEEGKINKPLKFGCLDLEGEALRYIEDSIKNIDFGKKQFLSINYLHRDITSIIRDEYLKSEIKGSNLIYLSGIYDYLSDKMGEKLLSEMYALLPADGKLIICNISAKNDGYRAYYELLGEWPMIHRSEEMMLYWTRNLKNAHIEFAYPVNGENYNFLTIKKLT